MYKIGIDIGGTKITIGLFDAKEKQLLTYSKNHINSISDLSEFIYTEINSLCNEKNINISGIESIGIGIPGTVSKSGKKIIKAPNIKILDNSLVKNLEEKFNVPVTLVQDSRAAAYGEFLCGKCQNSKVLVCVTLGTGIGTGIVINGKIFDGALGTAGELGHFPAVKDGRVCGCGNKGCLEKYVAGGGLDISAEEILGKGKTATDLFNEAKNGNRKAKEIIDNAVLLLGKQIVGIINLLSPDRLVFSGGLSNQVKLYLNPLIDYIKKNCYKIDFEPTISVASLGELSPLYGAAFVPIKNTRKPLLSASIMCADVLNFKKSLKEIENAGIEYLHCDIMDNHFVPNLMLPMELLNKLKPATSLPFDYHLMVENPENVIEKLSLNNNDFVSVHYESTPHLQKVITLIKEKGAKVCVALNPGTPISAIEELLPQLDMVLIMTVNPGFAGQKIVPNAFEKIAQMRSILDNSGYSNILIQVDGNCSFENVPKMYSAGADMFVVGTSSVFNQNFTVADGTEKLRKILNEVK